MPNTIQAVRNNPSYEQPVADFKIRPLICKVANVAYAIFELLLFPLRYIGSKTCSIPGVIVRAPYLLLKRAFVTPTRTFSQELFGTGYHRLSQKTLNQEETKNYFKYACAAVYAHACENHWISPFNFTLWGNKQIDQSRLAGQPLKVQENCFLDPETGLKASLLQKGNELIIAFGARGSSTTETPITISAIANIAGILPQIYEDADRFVTWLKDQPEFKGKTITLTGQCFGGSLASYCALKHKLKAVALNPFAIGPGIQAQIPSENLRRADEYVTNINAKGDVYSDSRLLDALDLLACAAGIKTAGSFGKRFSIPSAYKNGTETHNYFFGSMMKHVGFGIRTKTNELPDSFFRSLN